MSEGKNYTTVMPEQHLLYISLQQREFDHGPHLWVQFAA